MNRPNGKNDLPGTAGGIIRPSLTPPARSMHKRHTGPRLHQLAHDIRDICRRNPQGPQSTQIDRRRTLLLCATQLFQQGVYRRLAVNLHADDVRILVNGWHAERLTVATIRNRLSYLRWLARKIGKPQLIAQSNRAYGAGRNRTEKK